MKYHPVAKKITDLLTGESVWFETFEHDPVRTSEEAAQVRPGYSMKQGAKALIIKTKMGAGMTKFVMLVLPGDKKFDKNKTKSAVGFKDMRFATEEEVLEISNGVKVGGVPPFGNLFGLEVIADPGIFENEKIIFNAGDRSFSVAMKAEDFLKIVQPNVAEIA